MNRVFIDGQAGTTGLEIFAQLAPRTDIKVLEIDAAARKNDNVKKELMREADVVILCLPDDAAIESAALAECVGARVLDASTAHRVHDNWAYGLAELPGQRAKIAAAQSVSNPGCYPTGFIPCLQPLVSRGIVPASTPITVNAISGYSGGGHNLIDRYVEHAEANPPASWSARPYALSLAHKHVPEMKHYAGLEQAPLFTPTVANFHKGMLVHIPLFRSQLTKPLGLRDIVNIWQEAYADESFIRVHEPNDESELDAGFLDPEANNNTNRLDLFAFGSDNQFVLTARLDNLGKGASGAAIQNLNLMLQLDESTGLTR